MKEGTERRKKCSVLWLYSESGAREILKKKKKIIKYVKTSKVLSHEKKI